MIGINVLEDSKFDSENLDQVEDRIKIQRKVLICICVE